MQPHYTLHMQLLRDELLKRGTSIEIVDAAFKAVTPSQRHTETEVIDLSSGNAHPVQHIKTKRRGVILGSSSDSCSPAEHRGFIHGYHLATEQHATMEGLSSTPPPACPPPPSWASPDLLDKVERLDSNLKECAIKLNETMAKASGAGEDVEDPEDAERPVECDGFTQDARKKCREDKHAEDDKPLSDLSTWTWLKGAKQIENADIADCQKHRAVCTWEGPAYYGPEPGVCPFTPKMLEDAKPQYPNGTVVRDWLRAPDFKSSVDAKIFHCVHPRFDNSYCTEVHHEMDLCL